MASAPAELNGTLKKAIKKYPSKRLFKNPFLEFLTHVHPITPLVLWAPVIGFFIWKSLQGSPQSDLTPSGVGAWMILGLLVWTVSEYGMHRYIFHFKSENSFLKTLVYLFHGIHHEQSDDPTRLVMPPIAAILFASIYYLIFRALLGSVIIEAFFPGFLIGYLWYDYTHYAVHHFRLKSNWAIALKKYHMNHHFITPDQRYGVSSPLWDLIFGTFPKSVSVEESQQSKSSGPTSSPSH